VVLELRGEEELVYMMEWLAEWLVEWLVEWLAEQLTGWWW